MCTDRYRSIDVGADWRSAAATAAAPICVTGISSAVGPDGGTSFRLTLIYFSTHASTFAARPRLGRSFAAERRRRVGVAAMGPMRAGGDSAFRPFVESDDRRIGGVVCIFTVTLPAAAAATITTIVAADDEEGRLFYGRLFPWSHDRCSQTFPGQRQLLNEWAGSFRPYINLLRRPRGLCCRDNKGRYKRWPGKTPVWTLPLRAVIGNAEATFVVGRQMALASVERISQLHANANSMFTAQAIGSLLIRGFTAIFRTGEDQDFSDAFLFFSCLCGVRSDTRGNSQYAICRLQNMLHNRRQGSITKYDPLLT
jgi:hypothetical protein